MDKMAILDIRSDFKSPKINGIAFDNSRDFIKWSAFGVYMAGDAYGEPVFLVSWGDLDNLIMALKKAKELHELQSGGEK